MIIKLGGVIIVKNEKEMMKFFIKLWSGFIFIIASTFFANQMNLHQVAKSMGVFNVIYFIFISIYGFVSCTICMKYNKPTNTTLTIFSGSLVSLFYAIFGIIWYNVDQVTEDWLDLMYTTLEFCLGTYFALTIFIISNLKIIDLKKHKELDDIRESKKITYEKERRERENDRRIRTEGRRKILDGLANITVDRRVGSRDRRKPNQTPEDFKINIAKRTGEMVEYLTDTLDKFNDEINDLDEEIKNAEESDLEYLEKDNNILCIKGELDSSLLVENTPINDEDEDDEEIKIKKRKK